MRPTNCLKCLDVCPKSLLMFRPMEEMDETGAPIRYEIHMVFKAFAKKFCPDCLKCVDICPSNAIELGF
ncbi:MAG: 4Fe-4S dicluster domain-containing protein [Candidatus Lokiarchaeota archaeon]|nr:4Fe-4S dicluster domain-containing protein [Candidatus Lokiarchaeota archaeon]MBD3340348.1 4Fe-4S dicluster domain-containing protein [Candidatus Lokiarchaeota archaeon]